LIQEIGILCVSSQVGLEVLFHKYSDGSEKPKVYSSKTFTNCLRGYEQIEKKTLAFILGLNKLHKFLYGRKFILITDHKLLLSLFMTK
jgi:hypothetical protein